MSISEVFSSPQVVAAFITGCFATFITPYAARWLTDKPKTTLIPEDVVPIIRGLWKLSIERHGPDGKDERELEFALDVKDGKIVGSCIDSYGRDYREEILIEGEVQRDRFVILHCRARNSAIDQFCHMVLERSPNWKVWTGKSVGFGSVGGKIFSEDVILTRKKA